MKHASTLVPILASMTLSACSSSDKPPPDPMPAPFTTKTNFTAFVRAQIDDSMTTQTAVPAEAIPVEIDAMKWEFTDDDNETAFDDIITKAQ